MSDGDGNHEDGRISPITSASMNPDNNEYATPPEIWRPLSRAVDGFDLDAASGAESTPIAPDRLTKEDDGLTSKWYGDVWLNPPWSTNGNAVAKEDWLRKAISESNREDVNRVVMLLPVDTSTHWFHDLVLQASAVCFVGPGRIAFEGGDRNPSFALMAVVFGPVTDDLTDALNELGAVFRGRELHSATSQQTL